MYNEMPVLSRKNQIFSFKDVGFYNKFRIFGKEIKLKKKISYDYYYKALKKWYKYKTNEILQLEQPEKFNEKILWLLMNDKSALKNQLSNRLHLRDYISSKAGDKYLIPLIGVWENADDIDFNRLPEQYVVKSINTELPDYIVKQSSREDLVRLHYKIKKYLKRESSENDYLPFTKNKLTSGVIIEEYLAASGEVLNEYKVWCFNGIPYYVGIENNNGKRKTRDIYDMDWELQAFECDYKKSGIIVPPPANMHRMIDACKSLSKDFYFTQINFYNIDEKLYISDIKFCPDGVVTKILPAEYNLKLGEMLIIPVDKLKNKNLEKICV